jgi:hypothetical protein
MRRPWIYPGTYSRKGQDMSEAATATEAVRVAAGLAPDDVLDRYLCKLAEGTVRELFARLFGRRCQPALEVSLWEGRPALSIRPAVRGQTRLEIVLRYRSESVQSLKQRAGWEAFSYYRDAATDRDLPALSAGGLSGRAVIAEAARLWAGILAESHFRTLPVARPGPEASPFADPLHWLKHPGGPAACGMEAELAQAMAGSRPAPDARKTEGQP